MAIIFDLLKDLLIWAMTFVGEDVNQFRMIVGILCYATPSLQLLPRKMFLH